MTRINADVPAKSLSDQHLRAEYREIGRISTLFKNRLKKKKNFDDVPEQFSLGEGHVKFFFNKGKFVKKRWNSLVQEMKRRKFSTNLEFRNTWEGTEYYNDWTPTAADRKIIVTRLKLRTKEQKGKIFYYGVVVSLKKYLNDILK